MKTAFDRPGDSRRLTAGCSPACRQVRTRLLDGEGTAEGDGLTKKEGI